MSTFTTAYLFDGREVDVPQIDVDNWQSEVAELVTTLSLGDWYTESGDENQDEIRGSAEDDPRCPHDEYSHRVANESQIGEYQKDKTTRMTRVCHRRPCLLDAMAWVERGSGERAAWAAPESEYTFDLPEHVPAAETAAEPLAEDTTVAAPQER
jgi:hypothetical protein